jgi:predicted AlkP superfamily phosphohydrolase/phosphomutase
MATAPLVIFGLDSGDPDLLLRWTEDGTLPTIAALRSGGTCARLDGSHSTSTHELWTSIFTGQPADRHGYYLRRQLVPGTYRIEPVSADDVDAMPFWSGLAGSDRTALIVDVPHGHLVAGLAGKQLMGWGEHPTPARVRALPEGLLADVERTVGARIATNEWQSNRWWDLRQRRRILERIEKKRVLCEHLIASTTPDLTVVVFGDSHASGHRFTKYASEDGRAAAGGARLRGALREIYRAMDETIAALLRVLPEEANVLLVADCGIQDGSPIDGLMRDFCKKLGYTTELPSTTLGQRSRAFYSSAFPSSLHDTLDPLLPRRARVLLSATELDARIDWPKTTAFMIPAHYTGYVRVNLAGREPLGIVEPGPAYFDLLDRLQADFDALVDPATGEPAILECTRTCDVYGGGPPERLPDLFVQWRSRPGSIDRVVHPRTELRQPVARHARGNHHTREGFLLARGPSIASNGYVEPLSPLDVAPLCLTLLGEHPEASLRGRVKTGVLRSTS